MGRPEIVWNVALRSRGGTGPAFMAEHDSSPPHEVRRAAEDLLLANHRRFSHAFEHLPAAA
jgi:hypothetical protein